MAEFVDKVNSIALIERFNHVGRLQECGYAGIEPNIPFQVIYISVVEGRRIILSLKMGFRWVRCSFHPVSRMSSIPQICIELTTIG